MRMLAMIGVVWLMVVSGKVSAGDSKLEALFPDEGLRYKSCQIKLNPTADGYVINIQRDCPSGYCYDHQQEGSIKVNAQQIEVFGKILTNSYEIIRNNKSTALEVREYDEWNEQTSIGASVSGSSKPVLVGHFRTKLKMRVDNETGQVEKFQAYAKGNVNWGASMSGGILTTLRALYAVGKKVALVDCESPAQEMRKTMSFLLEEAASVYEGDKVLSDEERAALDAKLLEHLPTAEKDEYADSSHFGDTPLHYAARLGLEKFARRLITVLPQEAVDRYYRRGNPINFQNSDGDTPLHLAAGRGQVRMVKLLLATRGIDTHTQDYDDKTAQQVAVDNAKKHCEADVSSQDCKNAQEIVAIFAE